MDPAQVAQHVESQRGGLDCLSRAALLSADVNRTLDVGKLAFFSASSPPAIFGPSLASPDITLRRRPQRLSIFSLVYGLCDLFCPSPENARLPLDLLVSSSAPILVMMSADMLAD